MKPEDIKQARRTLGLGEYATLKEVKSAYRRMAKKHHPDHNQDSDSMGEVARAYKLLMDYIGEYRYRLTPGEFRRQNPGLNWEEQVLDDPLWGRGE